MRTVSAAVAACSLLVGCGGEKKPEEKPNPVKNEESPAATKKKAATNVVGKTHAPTAPTAPTDNDIAAAVAGSITCLNGISKHISTANDLYRSWAGSKPSKPPTRKSRRLAVPKIHKDYMKMCVKALDESAKKPYTAELTAANKAYRDHTRALLDVMDQAYAYYDAKNYKDDKFAKANVLHGKLLKAFSDSMSASRTLRQNVVKINDQLQINSLKRVEKKYGRTVLFLKGALMGSAKTVLRLAKGRTLQDLPLDTFTAAVTAYEELVVEFRAYVKKHPEEDSKWLLMSSFEGARDVFLERAKAVMRRKRDAKKLNRRERTYVKRGRAHLVAGHPDSLLTAYNPLVSASNQMRRLHR